MNCHALPARSGNDIGGIQAAIDCNDGAHCADKLNNRIRQFSLIAGIK